MIYEPITKETEQSWIDWLSSQRNMLNGKVENSETNQLFGTPEGDIATAKDLIGNLLALLTKTKIEIN